MKTAIEVAPELGGFVHSGDLCRHRASVGSSMISARTTRIVVSSDLDEFAIAGLRGDPVDVYGVGTRR